MRIHDIVKEAMLSSKFTRLNTDEAEAKRWYARWLS